MFTHSENWVLVFILCAALVAAVGCSCGDDDDDDDDAAADDADDSDGDDTTADDDTTDVPPCDGYDVVIEGETDLGGGETSLWTARLLIADEGTITGVVEPDAAEPPPYDVTGFRNDETTGYVDGSFETPTDMAGACAEALVFVHMDLTITAGVLDGDVTFYCGSVDEANLIGSVRTATGNVTCGDFAA